MASLSDSYWERASETPQLRICSAVAPEPRQLTLDAHEEDRDHQHMCRKKHLAEKTTLDEKLICVVVVDWDPGTVKPKKNHSRRPR